MDEKIFLNKFLQITPFICALIVICLILCFLEIRKVTSFLKQKEE